MADALTKDNINKYLPTIPDNSKIYIGCDSERFKVNDEWWADYSVVLVIHKGQNKGCKIFGRIIRERDYDQNRSKPVLRLMKEVQHIVDLYEEFFNILIDLDCEIHLDINPDERFGSSCVVNQAIGYVKGVCGIEPKVKPDAFMASTAADRFKRLSCPTPL